MELESQLFDKDLTLNVTVTQLKIKSKIWVLISIMVHDQWHV